MDPMLKESIWQQYGAAIDMLSDAINLCPDEFWTAVLWDDPDDARYGQFWYVAYHTLSWLDLYLTSDYEHFAPPPPFMRRVLPERPYTKAQIQTYLDQLRRTCQLTIASLTDEQARELCTFEWIEASYLEMQLYTMRHIQEHAAQMNLRLGQLGVTGMDWVPQARATAP